MIPQKTIEELINKHLNLEKDLSSGEIDKKKFAEKSKEYSDINEIIAEAKKYLSFEMYMDHIIFLLKYWIFDLADFLIFFQKRFSRNYNYYKYYKYYKYFYQDYLYLYIQWK